MTKTTDPTAQLAELIRDVRIAMLTTTDKGGALRSRPMATQKHDFDGELWFFTRAPSPKTAEVAQDQQVGLSYANPEKQRYVSVTGRAAVVRDPGKMQELWNPIYRAWFPDGLDDPELALLRVSVEKAEYWDSPSGMALQIIGFAKAILTGQPIKGGRHEKLDLH